MERILARKGKENFVFKELLSTIPGCFIESDAGSITRNSVLSKNSPSDIQAAHVYTYFVMTT